MTEGNDQASQNALADQAGSSSQDRKDTLAGIVAGVVVVGFILAVAYLFWAARNTSPDEWQRMIFVFSGVEAVVFAAVGWLFGREVSRGQAKAAEQRADANQEQAMSATARASDLEARGQAALAAVDSRAATYVDPAKVRARGVGADSSAAASTDYAELADFMRKLYADL